MKEKTELAIQYFKINKEEAAYLVFTGDQPETKLIATRMST